MSTERALNVTSGTVALGAGTRSKWHIPHGAIRFTADRVAPASFFMLFVIAKGVALPGLLGRLEATGGLARWQLYAQIANYVLVCLFMATVVGLYMVRRPAIHKQNSVWQRSVALTAAFITSTLAFAPSTLPGLTISLASSVLIVIGEVIAVMGLISLRGCFGILPEVRGMVTGGLYGKVRHPVYLGESIASVGIAMPVLSPVTGAILAGYFLLQWRRSLYEEALLAEAFPEYAEYSSRTSQFVPFIL